MSEFYIERNVTGGPPPTSLNAADESSPDAGGYSFRYFGGRRPGGQGSQAGLDEEPKDPPSFEQPPVEVQISPGLIADSEGQTPIFPPPPPDKAVIPPPAIKEVVEQNLQKAEQIVKTELGGTSPVAGL